MNPVDETQMRLILKAQSYGDQEIESFIETTKQVQDVDFEFQDLIRVDQLSPIKHAGLEVRNLAGTISGEFTDVIEDGHHKNYVALDGNIHQLSPYEMVVITWPNNAKGGNAPMMFPDQKALDAWNAGEQARIQHEMDDRTGGPESHGISL